MEENNRKGPGVFYAVVGVATLVVAIIGATFAYFSAATDTNSGTIKGQTNNIDASDLTLTVTRLGLNPTPAPDNDNLVPATFGTATPTTMDAAAVNRALTNKCVNDGYTGCHVWKITARSSQTVGSASVNLHLGLSNVTDTAQWSYVVYQGTDSTASTIVEKNTIPTTFDTNEKVIDIHKGAGLTAATDVVYYVMVYLNNVDAAQNGGESTGATNALGSYTGTVQLLAAGTGQVKASFAG